MSTRATRQRYLALVPQAPANTASVNIRLSKKAKEENLSKEGMLADAKALCARLGLTVKYIHIDEKSGAVRNRKGFMDWLADGREGRVSVLVAFHVDRMTREGTNVAAMILDVVEGKDSVTGQVVRHPVRLVDCKGLDSEGDDTAFRFRLVIEAEVARAERARMADRSRDMHARMQAAGRRAGGPLPYGFKLDAAGKLVPDALESQYLREAGLRALAKVKLSTIVRWANRVEGFTPHRADAWSRTVVRQALTITPTGTGEDIFTPDERAALRKILAPTPNRKPAGRQPTRLCSGRLLRCPGCGGTLRVARRSKKDQTKDYKCQAEPGACPHRTSVRCDWIETFIERKYLDSYGDQPEYVRHATVSGAAAVEDAEGAVARALAELSVEATPEAFARLQEAQVQRQAAEDSPQVAEVELAPTGRTIAEAWAAADLPEKRDMLAQSYAEIIVGYGRKGARAFDGDNRLTIVAHPPFVAGVHETVTYVPGGVVVVPEEENETAAQDRLLA